MGRQLYSLTRERTLRNDESHADFTNRKSCMAHAMALHPAVHGIEWLNPSRSWKLCEAIKNIRLGVRASRFRTGDLAAP